MANYWNPFAWQEQEHYQYQHYYPPRPQAPAASPNLSTGSNFPYPYYHPVHYQIPQYEYHRQEYNFLDGFGNNQEPPLVVHAPTHASTNLSLNSQPYTHIQTLTGDDVGRNAYLLLDSDFVMNQVYPTFDCYDQANIMNGVSVGIWDSGEGRTYRTKLLRSRVGNDYYLTENWYKKIVKKRHLTEGSEIGLSWDRHNSRFNFFVL
ncbi:hypothetical protein ACFE04_000146 [Oxalis oulophora]